MADINYSRMSLTAVSFMRDNIAVLDDIHLDLQVGEIIALLGPNGAGKSTLIDCASATIPCSSGRILLDGQDIDLFSPFQRSKRLAVLPQQSALNFPFVVEDVVALGRYPHNSGHACDAEITQQLMAILHIEDLAKRPYTLLSGGEKQRVQLARILSQLVCNADLDVVDNGVLLLDEPIAALDMPHQSVLMMLLKTLAAKGLSVLMVLHDVNLAAAYADKIALLKAGHLLAFDQVDKVITESMIQQVYDIDVNIIAHPKTAKPFVIREV